MNEHNVLDYQCIELVFQVNDTAMRLFSDTQDEDQRRIADLVVERMEKEYPPTLEPSTATGAALTGTVNLISQSTYQNSETEKFNICQVQKSMRGKTLNPCKSRKNGYPGREIMLVTCTESEGKHVNP